MVILGLVFLLLLFMFFILGMMALAARGSDDEE